MIRRFGVLRAGGQLHVLDRQTGDLGVIDAPALGGRLAEYAGVIDPAAPDAAWAWEQILNCFPLDAARHVAEQVSNIH